VTGAPADDGLRPRPVGRPRKSGSAPGGNPRDRIVAVATRLFAQQGYANTTMSAIAAAAGLRQPSLYYWFKRKELILQAALGLNRPSVDFAARTAAGPGRPAVKLFRLVRYDAFQICVAPLDFNEVERLAEEQPDLFASFWHDYEQLRGRVAGLVAAGADAGQFVADDPELAALAILAASEGMQKRFRTSGAHGPSSPSPFRFPVSSAEAVAEHLACAAVRALLADPSELDEVRAQAAIYPDLVVFGDSQDTP
jgi:TetR/AcrR family transcriptional regulator